MVDEALSGDTIILGTSGFAIELGAQLPEAGMNLVGFVGPEPVERLPGPWLGEDAALSSLPPAALLVAIGLPSLRRSVTEAALASGRRLARFVHPRAWVAPNTEIGAGSIVYANATIHARVVLGQSVVINSNVSVGHETVLGDFVTLSPGVALGGRMQLGREVFFGIGASAIQGLTIADGAIIGAGAAVVRSLTEAKTYVGVPARSLGR